MPSVTDRAEGVARLAAALRAATERAAQEGRVPVVLIDGPSGAGKSTLGDAVSAQWPRLTGGAAPGARLVRMDDLYPGWDGLDAGTAALAQDLLEPFRAAGTGHYRRWDWAADKPLGDVAVPADRPLVVEGCGALGRAGRPYADLAVWLDADDALRKRRALDRDGETFAREWDRWQRQFDAYVRRDRPREAAGLRLDITGWPGGRVLDPATGD